MTLYSLLPPLITDLSHLLLPSLPLLLSTLISLTAPSPLVSANPKLLQRVYDVLGALFRDLGKAILAESEEGGMADVWQVVRRGLGAPALAKEEVVEMETEPAPVVEEKETDEEEEEEADEGEENETPVASTSTAPAPAATPAPTPRIFTLPPNLRTTPQTRRLLGSAFAFLVRKARSSPTNSQEEGELEQLTRMMVEDVAAVEELDEGVRSSRGRGAKGRGKGVGKGRGQEEGSSKLLAEGVTWVIVETCSVSWTSPSPLCGPRLTFVLSSLSLLYNQRNGRPPTLSSTLAPQRSSAPSTSLFSPSPHPPPPPLFPRRSLPTRSPPSLSTSRTPTLSPP